MNGQGINNSHGKTMSRLYSNGHPAGFGISFRFVLLTAISLGFATALLPVSAKADSDTRWFGKRDLSLQERRQRRQHFSDAFTAKLGPEYQTNVHYVSQQTIDGLGQSVVRYRKIIAAGGWKKFPGSMTIQPNDHGNPVAELRRHLALTGDLRVQSCRARSFDTAL